MPKMVIEVPEEFTEVGKAMAEHLAALQGRCPASVAGKVWIMRKLTGDGRECGRTELAGHRAILQSLDMGCSGGDDWRGALHAGGTV